MASYYSDFIIKNRLSEEELLDEWSDLVCRNDFMLINEDGYDFIVMKNSYVLYDSNHDATDYYYDSEDYDSEEAAESAHDADTKWFGLFHTRVKEAAETKIQVKKLETKQKEEAKQAKLAQEETERRRVRYKSLKLEFGD